MRILIKPLALDNCNNLPHPPSLGLTLLKSDLLWQYLIIPGSLNHTSYMLYVARLSKSELKDMKKKEKELERLEKERKKKEEARLKGRKKALTSKPFKVS